MVYFFCILFCASTCVLAYLLTRANRLLKKHDSDMAAANLKYRGKCFHCYSRQISSHRPLGYDSEHRIWTDRSPFDLYIPDPSTRPTLLSEDLIQEEVRLQNDIYAAYKVFRPFHTECIGNINPYTKRPIMSGDDYDEYLRALSHDAATHLRDPFAL